MMANESNGTKVKSLCHNGRKDDGEGVEEKEGGWERYMVQHR